MNITMLDLEVLRQDRQRTIDQLARYQSYDEFSTVSENAIGKLISQISQWFQVRQFHSGSARRAHAV